MSWRDRAVSQGAFRGVTFWFSSVEGELGRRTSLKEFPGRDQPYIEDLGRRARRFTIDLYVLGDNYDFDRDRLRVALETPGPGELEHPYWGVMIVTVDGSFRVRESTQEQGIARFTVTFVEAGDELTTTQRPSTATAVTEAAQKVTEVANEQFAAQFSVLNAIAEVAAQAVQMVELAASTLNSVRGKIAAALQVVDDMKSAIDAVAANAASLIALPQSLATSLVDLYNGVLQAITEVTSAFENLAEFFGADGEEAVPAVGNILSAATRVDSLMKAIAELSTYGDSFEQRPETTSQQIISAENQRQFVRFIKTTVAAQSALVVAELTFENLDQATAIRSAVVDLIDEVLLDEYLQDELYTQLAHLRAIVVEHLGQAANALPELDDYVPGSAIPALVLAYQLYGDSQREAEILARNPQLRDPTSIPGGAPIKVLSDEE